MRRDGRRGVGRAGGGQAGVGTLTHRASKTQTAWPRPARRERERGGTGVAGSKGGAVRMLTTLRGLFLVLPYPRKGQGWSAVEEGGELGKSARLETHKHKPEERKH